MLKSLVANFEGETGFGVSVTEPDQCMSIIEIMTRYGMGHELVPVHEGALYDESDDEFEDDPTRDVDMDFLKAYELENEMMLSHSESIVESKSNEDVKDVDLSSASEQKIESNENASGSAN